MLTSVTVGSQGYVNFSAAMVSGDGVRNDPTAAHVLVYKVSQVDGSLARETGIGTDGRVDLAQVDSQVGFWGTGASIGDLTYGQFVVLFVMTFAAGESVASDTFVLDPGPLGPNITVTPGVQVDGDMS